MPGPNPRRLSPLEYRRLGSDEVISTAVRWPRHAPRSRRYSSGLRRLGFGPGTTVFYDEHVEADAVHEQIASVDMCGSLVADDPSLAADVLFGAQCSLALDGLTAHHLLGAWEAGRSGLRTQEPVAA